MTIRKLPAGGMWTPYPVTFINADAEIRTNSLFLSEEDGLTIAAYTVICPVSGVLDMFEVYIDGSYDSASEIKFSFQDLDANGFPDGSPDQYRIVTMSDVLSAWHAPGLMTDDGTDTGVKRTVTRGQKLALVIEFESATSLDIIRFGTIINEEDTVRKMPAGHMTWDGGAWQRATDSAIGVAALKYEEVPQYYPMPELIPINGLGGGGGFNSGTTPDEIGLEFAFPTPMRIGGASMCLSTAVDGAEFDCVLYDQAGNVLDTVPMKMYTALFPASGYTYWTARFSQDFFVPANEPYKVTVKPSSTDTVKLLELSFADSVILSDTFGYRETGGNEHMWIRVSRTNDGEWVYLATLPLISLNVTGVDMQTGGATDDWEGDA